MFTIYSRIIQIINQIIRKRDAIHRQAVAVLCRNLYRILTQLRICAERVVLPFIRLFIVLTALSARLTRRTIVFPCWTLRANSFEISFRKPSKTSCAAYAHSLSTSVVLKRFGQLFRLAKSIPVAVSRAVIINDTLLTQVADKSLCKSTITYT